MYYYLNKDFLKVNNNQLLACSDKFISFTYQVFKYNYS